MDIYIKKRHPKQLQIYDTLSGINFGKCILHIPAGTEEDYRKHPVFGNFKHIVVDSPSQSVEKEQGKQETNLTNTESPSQTVEKEQRKQEACLTNTGSPSQTVESEAEKQKSSFVNYVKNALRCIFKRK